MKKKTSYLIVLVLAFLFAITGAACNGNEDDGNKPTPEQPKAEYRIDGAEDVSLGYTVTEYDFLQNVTGTKDGAAEEVTADTTSVVFGTAGTYTVKYTCGDAEETITVKIYGLPTFVGEARYEAVYSENLDILAEIEAKDSFGESLEVTTNSDFDKDDLGRIKYGEHTVRYYATDVLGQTNTFDRTYVVTKPDGLDFSDIVVTAESPKAEVAIDEKTLSSISYKGNLLDVSEYTVKGGVLSLSAFVMKNGVGTYDFDLTFQEGYTTVSVEVQLSRKDYYGRAIQGAEMASLFEPNLAEGEIVNSVTWAEEENAFLFTNNATEEDDSRAFTLNADYFRGIVENTGASGMKFKFKLADESAQFFTGFWPDWWDSTFATMKGFGYNAEYQEYEFSFDIIPNDESGNLKTLLILPTKGNVYIKDVELVFPVEKPDYEVAKRFDLDGYTNVPSSIDLDRCGGVAADRYTAMKASDDGVPTGATSDVLKVSAIALWHGNAFTFGESYSGTITEDMQLTLRVYIEDTTLTVVEWWLYSTAYTGAAGDACANKVNVLTNQWYNIEVNVAPYLVDGKLTGIKFVTFTALTDAVVYFDEVVLSKIKGSPAPVDADTPEPPADPVATEIDVTSKIGMGYNPAQGSDFSLVQIGFGGTNILPTGATGAYYHNEVKGEMDFVKYVYINGVSIYDIVNAESPKYTTESFPMSMGGVFNPISVHNDGQHLNIFILNEYIQTLGDFTVTVKTASWMNTDGKTVKISSEINYQLKDGSLVKVAE